MQSMEGAYMKKIIATALCAISVFSVSSMVYAEDTIISEQVLYDEDGVKITATGFDANTMYGVGIPLLIENNSDKSIGIQFRNSSVNGCMSSFQGSINVEPGKKANDEIDILRSDLEKYNIEQVADIECSFHFFDPDAYTPLSDSSVVPIETNLTGKYEQKCDDSGDLIYDENGVKIVAQGVDNDSIWGLSPKFYMENNSDQPITIQVRDTSVNGYMFYGSFSAEIMPGKKCIDSITFVADDLKKNNIDSIDNLETSFHIFLTNDVSTVVADTPAIQIQY